MIQKVIDKINKSLTDEGVLTYEDQGDKVVALSEKARGSCIAVFDEIDKDKNTFSVRGYGQEWCLEKINSFLPSVEKPMDLD